MKVAEPKERGGPKANRRRLASPMAKASITGTTPENAPPASSASVTIAQGELAGICARKIRSEPRANPSTAWRRLAIRSASAAPSGAAITRPAMAAPAASPISSGVSPRASYQTGM